MFKKLTIIFLVLGFSSGLFAYEKKSKTYPWMASFNKVGQLNIDASVGLYGLYFDAMAGAEIIVAEFVPGGVPLQLGVGAKGILGFLGSYMEWGAAPMAILHWGTDFGGIWKFDWRIGLGVGFYGSTGDASYYYGTVYNPAFNVGFAAMSGVVWHFSKNLGLIIQGGYSGWSAASGIGIQFNT